MKRASFFALFVLILVGATFSLNYFLNQNSEPMKLKFLMWQTKPASLGLIVALSFLFGVILTKAVLLSVMFQKYFEARRLRRENEALQKLLEDQRAANSSVAKSA